MHVGHSLSKCMRPDSSYQLGPRALLRKPPCRTVRRPKSLNPRSNKQTNRSVDGTSFAFISSTIWVGVWPTHFRRPCTAYLRPVSPDFSNLDNQKNLLLGATKADSYKNYPFPLHICVIILPWYFFDL